MEEVVSHSDDDRVLAARMCHHTHPDNRAEWSAAFVAWQAQGGENRIRAYVEWLGHYALDPDFVDDIISDTMYRAYRHVITGQYVHRDEVPFTAFAKVIARNTYFNATSRKRFNYLSLEELQDCGLELHTDLDSLEDAIEAAESLHRLEWGLGMLTEDERYLVLERHIRGREYEELAHEIGKTPVAVRKAISRAFRKLRALLCAI